MEKIKFLDMAIQDSGNSDGVTLVSPDGCSVGNFGKDWQLAKVWAVRYFMIRRPEIFNMVLLRKMQQQGSGCYGEFVNFRRCCEDEGVEIPLDVLPTSDMNRLITVNGTIV